ncbi:MAG: cytochrome c biogenesis heme-transporting ATPase CcmA [Sulfuritalea sp.]|jgi:heme exporter protein A|nr:cytochrome c biogenesis heme-transporting ATPase CcmA [Sulfuritalea sp.]MBK9351870.1 cytochrome c biogenesis heme-transporting ATPase CcmA [Sulfuritalea sp.]MBP6637306.1 cytochrome c biogenesis heme-transporting ATPase CcmA [Sulfuritalea sp.]MBP7423269.1 cytochrome c biogenesis heme-transporting ATPase CcmA [Sulfuritalea sp.]
MLTVSGLACSRGERRLFANVGFALGSGEWLHVQGANGAGKTSLMRLLVGLSPADAGEIRWRGEPTPSVDFRREMIYLGHHAAVKEDLTPLENLRLSAALDGVALDERAALAALIRLGLRGREDLPVRVLSAGQKRRVLLARLLTRPAILWVLDEAFNALDVGAVKLLGDLIAEHLAAGGMAVLTSHQPLPVPGGKALVL